MEPTDFDRLSRVFADALSRRRLTRVLGGLPLAALLPNLAASVAEARGKGSHKHTLHAQKKKKKKKKKTTNPVSPPLSPSSPPASPPPPPPPGPRCPQAATPHFCASANACVPTCPFGLVFNPVSCKCTCPQERTCCTCLDAPDTTRCFASGIANDAACQDVCGSAPHHSFLGQPGFDFQCPQGVATTCELVCTADTVCGTANSCQTNTVCSGGSAKCRQPLSGGPTRCAADPPTDVCGCTSDQECTARFGDGAFCANLTGCNETCQGTKCVRT